MSLLNFSQISNDKPIGRLLRLPLGLLPPSTRVRVLQGRLKGKVWIVGASTHGCWLGCYEYHKQALFEKSIRPGDVVFDIGANVGYYTLLSSELVGPNGRVVAFEPVPRNLAYLKEHIRLNHISNATVIEAAVSDHSAITHFDEGLNHSMGRIAPQGALQVQTVTLDELVLNHQVPVPNVIKIDVEGAELTVLLGAQAVLAERHPTLFIATHGENEFRQCRDLVRSLGYDFVPFSEGTDGVADEVLAFQVGDDPIASRVDELRASPDPRISGALR